MDGLLIRNGTTKPSGLTTAEQGINGRRAEREKLRDRGQFWTPAWVASPMVSYVLPPSGVVLDPAFGKGAFYVAFRELAARTDAVFCGMDVDPSLRASWGQQGFTAERGCRLEVRDFITDPPGERFRGIVANPPYVRHHRLSGGLKLRLRSLAAGAIGTPLDGRAGLHVYFLIQALLLLEPDGKLAFLMPADACEGVFSGPLWRWICSRFRLDGVLTFAPEATPFPGVDTNAVAFFITNATPRDTFLWAEANQPARVELCRWVRFNGCGPDFEHLTVKRRAVAEGLATGLSRNPDHRVESRFTLADFARVKRGVETGGNGFFFLTRGQADQIGVPPEFLTLAVGRTRDVEGDLVDAGRIGRLAAQGRPTLLFAPDGRPLEEFPPSVRDYLRHGEALGMAGRAVLAGRRPWYRMERRPAPPILFAYLGRRNARFIRNLAGAVPLTSFLCVYPRQGGQDYVDRLWQVLRHPDTARNLRLVGKSYGSGAIKVEPRALERLPLPETLVCESGLELAGECDRQKETKRTA